MNVIRFNEPWAIDRSQEIHKEALMLVGEKVIMRRTWKLEDFLAGSVTRCVECQAGATLSERQRVRDVFKNSGDTYCPTCFGIGYTGGFENTIYLTWAIITDEQRRDTTGRTGNMELTRPMAQFLWTPLFDPGDLLVRVRTWNSTQTVPTVEQDRYILRSVDLQSIRTGPLRRKVMNVDPGPQTGIDEAIIIGQTAEIENVSQENPYREVPLS